MANRRFIDFPIASTSGDTDIILIWQDGLNKQTTKATLLSGLPEDLEDLNDVVISGLTNGQILRYNSTTGVWENTDQGNLDLNDLNDVTIVSPSNGQVLVYNSSTSKWENSSGGYVPYVGAVTTVNLGSQQLIAGQTTLTTNGSTDTLTINHTSGSGKAINVTKGGNGEGLYINKTSGSGNAATIVGTLEATTLVKTGGTSSQFLKADGSVDSTAYGTGTVTSVGLSSATSGVTIGSSPVTTSGTITLAIATASGSQNGLLSSTDWTTFNSKQNALTNPVTGTGTTNYLPKFTGASTIGNSQIFDNGTNVGIGTTTPSGKIHSWQGSSGQLSPNSVANGFIVEDNQSQGISILTPSTNEGNIFFGDESDNFIGGIRYFHTDDSLTFTANNAERMRITSSGNVGIGTIAPADLLNIDGKASYPFIRINSSGNTTARYFKIGMTDALLHTIEAFGPSTALNFLTSGSEKLRITSTGNVGIGTDSPAEKLEIQNGYISTYHNVNLNDAGYGVLFYTNGGGSKNSLAGIVLSQVGTARSGNLLFQTSNASAPTTKMTITLDGYVRLSASSGGIQFNGDTAAANALDDYEEGTWTPTYIGSSGGAVTSYSAQSGFYTKIGNVVTLTMSIASAKGTISGNISIGGIPYEGGSYYVNMTTRRRFATDFQLMGVVGSTQIDLFKVKSDSISTIPITDSDFYPTATNTYNGIIAVITYRTT